MSDVERFQDAVEVAIQRAVEQTLQLIPRFYGATVQELDTTGNGIHEVQLDGDVDPVAAHDVTTGTALVVGDRVACVAVPPHQLWIIGRFRDPA